MIGLCGLSYVPLIEIRIPLQISSIVHQKYKLKFFHYQGLSFIFLLKVHIEAEMQGQRLPLLWKQCYTGPAKEKACYSKLPGFSTRIPRLFRNECSERGLHTSAK